MRVSLQGGAAGLLVLLCAGLLAVGCSGSPVGPVLDVVLPTDGGGTDLPVLPPPDMVIEQDVPEGFVDIPAMDVPPADLPPIGDPDGGDGGNRCQVEGPPELNPGWIGGACTAVGSCSFDGAVCLAEQDGFPEGTCTQACDRLCPDREGPANTVTFCIDGQGPLAGSGMCVSKCDYARSSTGCRPGYACARLPRFGEAGTSADVCVPEDQAPPMPPPMGCYAEVAQACLATMPAENPMQRPDGVDAVCDVQDPLRLQSPVNGIHFINGSGNEASMFMRCQLALALYRLTELLKTRDVVELTHLGTYNCRAIAGTSSLSQHGLGLAIDLAEFKTSDGTTYNVLDDFEGDIAYDADGCRFNYTPASAKGKWLLELAEQMCEQRIFNIVLTPNYNEAHANHFHVDLTDGSQFIGSPLAPRALRRGVDGE